MAEDIQKDSKIHGGVYISLGGGVDFGITQAGELCMTQRTHTEVHMTMLGQATTKRIIDLQNYLGRLIIHAVDVS